jgi:light-regulated signal transduction histidine kinase (bacteriophytochrome)
MNYKDIKKEVHTYLKKAFELINHNDPTYKAFHSALQEQLKNDKIRNESATICESLSHISSEAGFNPDFLLLSAVVSIALKDKEYFENKLNDVTDSYDEVLGLITHEFKNILTSVHGYNMLLEKYFSRDKDKEGFDHLMNSDRLTRQLFDMTDSLLKMSLGEKGLLKPELKLTDFVVDILEPIKKDLETQLDAKKMRIVLQRKTKNLIFECDESLFDVVIRNLLLNAIKYGKQETDITVTINRDKNDFFVAVKNLSDDIPGNLCSGIFEKFRSRKIGPEKGGTGIGLYNVKNIITLHQGTITCKCQVGEWIEFKFNIPQKTLTA